MKKLIEKIEQWAEERNLINGSTSQKQFVKLMEEFGELCAGISKNNIDMIKDSIGDCFVVLTILSKQEGVYISEYAEKEIKKIYEGLNDKAYENETVEYSVSHISMGLGDIGRTLIATGNIQECVKVRRILFILNGLTYIAYNYKLNFSDCIKTAWAEIKDRKGKMINGVFVKEEDLCKP